MEINISVDISGPVFDGRAEFAVERFRQHLDNVLGDTDRKSVV